MQNTLDPNWFYSSLAQSSASIVGLFGAILATRLQAQIEQASEQQVRTNEALRLLHEAARPLFDRWSLYVERSPAQLAQIRDAIESKRGDFTAPRWYSPYDFGADNVGVGADQHGLEVESARAELASASLPHLTGLLGATDKQKLEVFASSIEPLLNEAAEGMPEQLRQVAGLSTKAALQLTHLTIRSQSNLFSVLWVCLVILSIGGLVVPLGFLSAYRVVDRVVLLGVVTIGLVALLVYVAFQIRHVRRLAMFQSLLPPVPKRAA